MTKFSNYLMTKLPNDHLIIKLPKKFGTLGGIGE